MNTLLKQMRESIMHNLTSYQYERYLADSFRLLMMSNGHDICSATWFCDSEDSATRCWDEITNLLCSKGDCSVSSSITNGMRLAIGDVGMVTVNMAMGQYDFAVYAHQALFVQLEQIINRHKQSSPEISLRWYFLNSKNELQSCRVNSRSNTIPLCSEMYPFVGEGGDIDEFLDSYFKSSSTILLLLGDPGTGKSSLIKHFINKFYKSGQVCVAYDHKVIDNDLFFKYFIGDHDLCVLEDADILITSRSSGNQSMQRILNVGDGIINVSSKKIIITSNVVDLSRIDDALLREGRCFDVVRFRPLTKIEANVVRDKLELPHLTEDGAYPLSKVFDNNTVSSSKPKMGLLYNV